MFADGLPDDLEPILAVLAIVAMVALYVRRSAARYGAAKGYPKRRRGLPDTTEWTCSNCGAHQDGSSRFCYSCMTFATIADDPGSTQMMVFMGWLPALIVAAVGGSVAALITWEPWPLLIVLLVGPPLGWLATVVFFFRAWEPWWRYSRSEGMAALLVLVAWLGVGPAVAIVLSGITALLWM